MTVRGGAGGTILAGNIAANAPGYLVASATLAGSSSYTVKVGPLGAIGEFAIGEFDIVNSANTITPWKWSARTVLAGSANIRAQTKQNWQMRAVLPGTGFIHIKTTYSTGGAVFDSSHAAISNTGLAAYWPFHGGSTLDFSGVNNHGYARNVDPTFFVADKLKLDGAGYIQVYDSTSLDITTAITISCRVKVDTFDADWQAIIAKGDNAWRLSRYSTSNNVGFSTTGLTNVDLQGTVNINDGLEHHIVAIWDGANKFIYVDGVLDTQIAATGTIGATAADVWIGNNSENAVRGWKGTIDDVYVFNRAVTSAEATILFNGNAGFSPGNNIVASPFILPKGVYSGTSVWNSSIVSNYGLVASYPFNDATPNDQSGNAHNGSNVGSPSYTGGKVQLNGTNYITVVGGSAFDITDAITLAARVKVDTFDVDWQAIITRGDGHWRLHRYGASNNVGVGFSGLTFTDVQGNANINDGLEHHVAATYDGARICIYVDGVLDVSHDATGSIVSGGPDVWIGNNTDITNRFWKGTIDDVRVYNRALSGAEIKNLFTPGTGGGNLVANPTVVVSGTAFAGSSVWAGVGNIAANILHTGPLNAVLPGIGNIVANPQLYLVASATLPGVANIVASTTLAEAALATLPGIANLIANPQLYLVANATLPGIANIVANPRLFLVANATLPGIANIVANPQLYLIASATLPGVANIIASAAQNWQSTAVLPGIGNIVASTTQNWQITAVLPGQGDISANILRFSPISAVLPGIAFIVTTETQRWASSSVWPGVGNIVANPQLYLIASATLPGVAFIVASLDLQGPSSRAFLAGSADIIASMTQAFQSTSVWPGSANIITTEGQRWASTAVLPGQGDILANILRFSPISAVLAGIATIITTETQRWASTAVLPGIGFILTDPKLFTPISAVLPGVANIIASTSLALPARATLPGIANLIATLTQFWAASSVWAGSANIIAATTQVWSSIATLPGIGNIVTNPTLVSSSSRATLPGIANIVASTTQRFGTLATLNGSADLIVSSSQRWQSAAAMAGQAGLIATMLAIVSPLNIPPVPGGSSNPPKRQRKLQKIKQRKQITEKKPPPEASLPEPVPLPPDDLPKPFTVVRQPIGTYHSPILDDPMALRDQVMRAHDQTDEQDAMAVLRAIASNPSQAIPPQVAPAPAPRPVPLPPTSAPTAYDNRHPVPVRANGQLTGMRMGDKHMTFKRGADGLVTGAHIAPVHNDDNEQQDAMAALHALGLL